MELQHAKAFVDAVAGYVEAYLILTSPFVKHRNSATVDSYLKHATALQEVLSEVTHNVKKCCLLEDLIGRVTKQLCPELTDIICLAGLTNGVALLIQAMFSNSHVSKDVKTFVLANYSTVATAINSELSSTVADIRRQCAALRATAGCSLELVLTGTHARQLLLRCHRLVVATAESSSPDAAEPAALSVLRVYLLTLLEQSPADVINLLAHIVLEAGDSLVDDAKLVAQLSRLLREEVLSEGRPIADLHLVLLCLTGRHLHRLLLLPSWETPLADAVVSAIDRIASAEFVSTAADVDGNDARLTLTLPDRLAWLRPELSLATVARRLRELAVSPEPRCTRLISRLLLQRRPAAWLVESVLDHFGL